MAKTLRTSLGHGHMRPSATIAFLFHRALGATNDSDDSGVALVERSQAPETRRRDMPRRVRVGSVADFADEKVHAVDAASMSVVVGFAGTRCARRAIAVPIWVSPSPRGRVV
jgi:hypothetical protein